MLTKAVKFSVKKNLNIIALDPAIKCGFAYCSYVPSYTFKSGVWNLKLKKDESQGLRLLRLYRNIDVIVKQHKMDLVVFEAARNVSKGYGTVHHAELQSVIKLVALNNEIEYKGYSPTSIKKHAGKGNASKEYMIKAAKRGWNKAVTDDEADALFLLDLAITEFKASACTE